MTEHSVVIAGGGPTGLMLAAELALAKVDVVVLERRPSQELAGSRAGGLHARTIEILDQRGVAERFLAEGETAQAAGFALNILDISDFPTRHPYALGLFQNKIERILAEWVLELGVPIRYGVEVDGLHPGRGRRRGRARRRRARSAPPTWSAATAGAAAIRKAAGIEFPGWDATTSALIAEVEMSEEPQVGSINDELGVRGMNVLEDGKTVRVIVTEQQLGPAGDASLDELQRGAGRRLRHRLRRPRPDLDLPLHRHRPARRPPTARAASSSPATPPTSTIRPAARGSRTASRTPSTSAGSSPR